MASQQADTPLQVRGYLTDPQRAGYQILSNYESTYWRALVGNEAWSLYEVLRSFCHEGHASCFPSINTLLAILGLKDRSVLIGRAKPKIVRGKEYCYPGLIQRLQAYDLVVAEATGEGAALRYIFHVNLTPGQLTDAQAARLPDVLQKKHADLVERCALQLAQLQAKKLPPKLAVAGPMEPPPGYPVDAPPAAHAVARPAPSAPPRPAPAPRAKAKSASQPASKPVPTPASAPPAGGIGISNTPIGNSNTPYWNFQYKQQPINNTHLTASRATRRSHNNSGGNGDGNSGGEPPPVVVALTAHGVAATVATRLADRYRGDRILAKIAYLEFLREEQPDAVKKPAAWLRRAVEDDYAAPDGFVAPAARARAATVEAQRAAAIEAAAVEAQQQQAAAAQARAAHLARLRAEFGLAADGPDFWAAAQHDLRCTARPDLYALVARAEILELTDTTLRLGVPDEADWRQLQHPNLRIGLERPLTRWAGHPLTLVVDRLELPRCSPQPV